MARRRKEDGRVGSASREIVRRLSHFSSRVRPRVSQIARGDLSGATPRGQPWAPAVTLSPGRNAGQRVVAKAVAFAYTRRALCCAIAPSSGDLNA